MKLRAFLTATVLLLLSATCVRAADSPTYHGDNTRQGNDTADAGLSSPRAAWTSIALDGAVYGQPVVAGPQTVVGTENNSVYSLNSATGAVQWGPVSLGTPRTAAFPCGNINPLGITGTAAIDSALGYVYVVAEVQDSTAAGPGVAEFDLVTLSLASGAVVRSVNIAPPATSPWFFDANYQQQRGALTITGGRVFVTLGGLAGDCTHVSPDTTGFYRGYVISYPETGIGGLQYWSDAANDPANEGGGIWASGGASVDAAGNVYVATGNSNHTSSTDTYDYSDSVVKLSPSTTQPVDAYAPDSPAANFWYADNAGDVDLGSVVPLQLPSGRILQMGKSGKGYLLSTSSLGNSNPSGGAAPSAELAVHQVCHASVDAAFGSLAYTTVGGIETVYVGCSDGVAAVQINGANSDFTALWYATAAPAGTHPPTVAGGLVWSVGGTTLYGFNAATGALVQSLGLTGSDHFTSATAAGDRLLVSGGNQIDAFAGLPPSAAQAPAAAWVDFNGDRKADYCRRVGTVNLGDSRVACTVSNGSGFGTTYTSAVLDWGYDTGVAWVDVNGDGMADYCRRVGSVNLQGSYVACTLSTATGFGATITSPLIDWGYDTGVAWVDANGDGKADYCRRVGSVNLQTSYLACTLSTGSGFGATITSPVIDWGYSTGAAWVDANGDGKADYCRRVGGTNLVSSYLSCTFSTGTGFGSTIMSGIVDWGYPSGAAWADFDGDRTADYCRRVGGINLQSSYLQCTPASAAGFGAPVMSGVIDWGYSTAQAWVDANGDGRADYCRTVGAVNLQSSYLECTFSTGTGFSTSITSSVVDWGYPEGIGWVDHNGDGTADYCRRVGAVNTVSSYVSCTVSSGTGFGTTFTSTLLDWGYNT